MPISDFEGRVLEFMGEIRAEVGNIKQGQKDQGERIGSLESKLEKETDMLHTRINAIPKNANGNGLRQKGVYAGGGIVSFELIHRIFEWITKSGSH